MARARRRTRRNYKTRIVQAFLSTYIIIALIPIIVGVTFYTYTLRVVYENEYDKVRVMLEQSVSAMDADFRTIRNTMSRLMQSSALTSLLTSDSPYEEPEAVMDSIEFHRELKQVYEEESLVYDVLVYLNSPNTLFGARSGYCFTRPDIFYPYFLEMEGISAQQWNELLACGKSSFFIPARAATLEGYAGGKSETQQLGLFVWPLYKDGLARGSVIFLLDASRFISDMNMAIDVDAGALAWVQTGAGEVIMSCPADVDVEATKAEDMLSVVVSSKYNQLEYNVLIPGSVIAAKVRWLRDSIVWMTALSVVLGLLAAEAFARRLGAPLDRISGNLRQLYAPEMDIAPPAHTDARLNPLEQLGDNVNELIVKHSQLSSYVSRQINVVDQLFFEKLLDGYFGDEEQIYDMLEHVSQPRLNGPFMLALVRMERADSELTVSEASEMSACRADAFAAELTARRDMFETALDRCVLIFSLSDTPADEIARQLRAALERIKRELSSQPDMRIKAALSLPVSRYIELSRVYARCAELIHSCPEQSEPALVYQRDMAPQAYSYSLDVENQLINFTVVGNRAKVHELILSVFGEERAHGHLSQSQRLLTQGMCATLMRICQMLGQEVEGCLEGLDDAAQRLAMGGSSAALDAVLGYFDAIVDRVQSRQRGRTDELIVSVKEYVDANHTDAELTLASTATHFSLTDAYLSRAFKDCTGVNFSTYLEKLRIDHALALIDEPLSLDEIAVRTGFDHLYNMRSAFKRTLGVTPSEYRKRVRQ